MPTFPPSCLDFVWLEAVQGLAHADTVCVHICSSHAVAGRQFSLTSSSISGSCSFRPSSSYIPDLEGKGLIKTSCFRLSVSKSLSAWFSCESLLITIYCKRFLGGLSDALIYVYRFNYFMPSLLFHFIFIVHLNI